MSLKKILTLFALVSSTFLFSQDVRVITMDGINMAWGENRDTLNTSLTTQVNDTLEAFSNYDNQVLIGQSQGGVRSLAYAHEMSEQGLGDRISAVVTIGSPVRGFSPLLKGSGRLKSDIDSKVKIISEGVSSFGGVLTTVLASVIDVTASDYLSFIGKLGDLFDADTSDLTGNELIKAIVGGRISDRPGAGDLSPNSSFLQDSYMRSVHHATTYRTVKIKDGRKPVYRYKKVRFFRRTRTIRIFAGWTTRYKYVRVVNRPAYTSYHGEKTIDDNVRIAMITGRQNDPAYMTDSPVATKTAILMAKRLFSASETVNQIKRVAAQAATLGIPNSLSRLYKTKKERAGRAKNLAANYVSVYSSFLGDSSHDCFIPRKDQAFGYDENTDSWEIGGRGLSDGNESPLIDDLDKKYHHVNERDHEDLWGEEASVSEKGVIDEDSTLGLLVDEANSDETPVHYTLGKELDNHSWSQ